MGADDYISKTNSMMFLVVRIQTLLRRIKEIQSGSNVEHRALIGYGDVEIDTEKLTIRWQGALVKLPLTQFWMVKALVEARGKIITAYELMKAANITVQPNTVQTHIMRIRNRFKDVAPNFAAIKNEHGYGYRWVPVDQDDHVEEC